jgi:hypothetical protein
MLNGIQFCLEYCCVVPKAKTKILSLYHGITPQLQCLYFSWSHLCTIRHADSKYAA